MIASIAPYLRWPWLLSIPLLLAGFGMSVFFVGTDSPLLGPAIICLLAFAVVGHYPNLANGWAVPKTGTFISTLMFGLWLTICLSWSSVPYISTIFTIIFCILPLYFAVCIMAARADEWTRVHGLALWLTGACFALWAIVQFVFMYEKYGPRIHHPMLSPNNLAAFFNLGLFPAVGMLLLARGRRAQILAGMAVALFYMALVVTQSRGGYLSFVVAMVVFLPFAYLKTGQAVSWAKLAFLAVVAVLIPLFCNHLHAGALEVNLVGSERMMDMGSAQDRFYLWESTWNMIMDHFWLGTGLASFYFYYPRYRMPLDRSDGFFTHMDPLQLWAETGVVTPIIFYAVLICVLLRTIKAVRAAGPDFKARLEIMAPFCGMLAMTGHTHIDFHIYMPGMLLPLAALLAYWYMATERALGDASRRFVWKPQGKARVATLALLAVVLLVPGIWVARASAVTLLMSKVQTYSNYNKQPQAEELLKVVGVLAPGSYGRYAEYEARFRIGKLWHLASKGLNASEAKTLYDEAHAYLDEAERLNPAFGTVWDLRARLYYAMRNAPFVQDGEAKAIALLDKVIANNPLAADARVGLANIYKARGDLQKAAQILEAGVSWPRQRGITDVNFLLALAEIKIRLGDREAGNLHILEAQRRAQSYGMPFDKVPVKAPESTPSSTTPSSPPPAQ